VADTKKTSSNPREPGFDRELELLASYPVVGFVDEVGRGCAAGPVTCGVVVLTDPTPPPAGLRDSKLLSPARRRSLLPSITDWAAAAAVGHVSAAEIDEIGLTAALRLAATRALSLIEVQPAAVLLDGSHDWLTGPGAGFEVFTMVKADLRCAAVAAASILAKVERDDLMVAADATCPGYGFGEHKGYLTAAHLEALQRLGPSELHRRSWNVRGVEGFGLRPR
jgi:ribonuclease HII